MDEFTRIKTFIKVVEAGSFSAAARNVSSVSAVARQVQALEVDLGVRLLNRSTRRIGLTDAGRRFYERVTTIAHQLSVAKSEVMSLQDGVSGLLRVALRITAGTTIVVPALPRLLETYPDLELDIILTDERRELITNNIDVAMWLGDMPDSELIARRLSPSRRIVCGSPAYFERHGIPENPSDLAHHKGLLFAAPSYSDHWTFTKGGECEQVSIRGNVRSDNGLVLLQAALAGLGIVVVHEWQVRTQIAGGFLRQVLHDYTVSPHPSDAELYAVFASNRQLSKKIRVFVDFLVEAFKETAGEPQG